MKIWQRSMVPTLDAYRVHGDGGEQDSEDDMRRMGFADQVLAKVRNMGNADDVLAIKAKSFPTAHHCVGVALGAGFIDAQQAQEEWADMEQVRAQVQACRQKIRSLNKAWEQMEEACKSNPIGSKGALKSQQLMLKRLADLDASWLLPNFIAWGSHRPVDIAWWQQKCPLIVEAARIDEKNGFLVCTNLDYGSFNLRMCAVVALLAQQGNVVPAVAAEILSHAQFMGKSNATKASYHLGWGLNASGGSLGFPDREGLGPMAFAALEKLVLTLETPRVVGLPATTTEPTLVSARPTRSSPRL